MKPEIQPGRVVFSKKGRDKGRYFVVLYMVDADFVMMTDGDTRKLDHQKKKRRKHLCACPFEAPALLEKLAEEGKDASFISLYYGEDVTEDAAQAAGARFQAVCPDAEISVLSGGQPVYYYIISFE